MHYYMDDDSGGSWWWMLPAMLVFVVALGAVVWAVLAATRPQAGAGTGPLPMTPGDVLAHRLARGEIDPAEYSQRLDALRHHRGDPSAS